MIIPMNFIRSCIQKPASPAVMDYALCFLRIVIGALYVGHGIPKLIGGPALWLQVGTPIALVGVHVVPMFWGFLAGCAETFGGLSLVLGFGTRLAAIPLTCTMIVASILHLTDGSAYHVYAFPLTLLAVCITFLCVGSGTFSLDYYFYRRQKQASDYHPLMNRPEDYL